MQFSRSKVARSFAALAVIASSTALFVARSSTATAAALCSAPTVGEVNTAWPLVADVAPGATSATISNLAGDRVGAAVNLQPGDLVMFMQIMDATINTTNTANYGGNNGTGGGYTALGLSGAYEYGRVSTYDTATGLFTLQSPVTGTYKTTGTSRAQVVRIPEFENLTLTANLTSPTQTVVSSDRVAGGVVAISVSGTLNLNGFAIHSDKLGFLGGQGTPYSTFETDGTRWTTTLTVPEGGKGHSIAGTPTALQNVLGGKFGQGAPANGGGGGGDVDGPGSGGGNGGFGGSGGAPWSGTARSVGGAAIAVPAGETLPQRLIMGGGGGGGNGNNGTQTEGGQGGGITIVHAGAIAGTGQIRSNGEASISSSTDASGGAGAGGTVIVTAPSIPNTVTIQANGGGTSASQNTGSAGGGGRVSTSSTPALAATVSKGTTSGAGTGAASDGLKFVGTVATPPANLDPNTIACDFGDLPDAATGTGVGNYQSNKADGNAVHNPVGVRFGASRTAEAEANQNATATGDVGDDGLLLTHILPGATSVSVPVDVQNISGTACVVGYLDQNGDGDFADAGETATKLTGITTNGTKTLSFTGLTGGNFVAGGKKAVRIRVTSDTAFCSATNTLGSQSVGYAADGEIEDYFISVERWVDIKVTKTLATPVSGTVVPGSALSWKVAVTNLGPDAVVSTGIAVTDTVPAGTTGSWTCAAAGGAACPATSGTNLSVTVLTLPLNATTTFTFTGTAAASLPAGTLDNTAKAVVGSTMVDTDPSNNTSTVMSPIQLTADLGVNKTPATSTINAGQSTTWSLTMTNNGPHVATDAVLVDVLPAGLTATAVSSAYPGATCSLATAGCTVAQLPVGATLTMSVTASAPSSMANGTVVSNTATASTTSVDSVSSNNTKTATLTVNASADLSIAKGDVTGTAGQGLAYPVVVTNAGPSDALSVKVTDTVPAGLTFNPATSSTGCVLASGVITCTIGTLTAGSTSTLALGFTVDSAFTGASINNTASVSSTTTDPSPANNTDSGTATIGRSADLSIAKVLETDPPIAGGTSTWLLTIHNDGPSSAINPTITDTLPSGATAASASILSGPAGGSCTNGTGTIDCTWASLGAGASATVRVSTTLDSALGDGVEVINSAAITSATADPVDTNNSASDSGTSQTVIKLDVAKSVSPTSVHAGEAATFTITVKNSGLSDATDIVVDDVLPAGLTVAGPVTSTFADCGSGEDWVNCTFPRLAPGVTRTFTVPVIVAAGAAAGTITNTATISAAGQPDAQVSAGLAVTRSADLSLAKDAAASSVDAGDTVDWTLVVTNNGPSTANGVTVTDALPIGTTFVSASTGCAESGGTVTCAAPGAIDPNGTAEFTVTLKVDPARAAGTLSNTASVTGTETDPDTTDNTATASTSVTRSADLAVTKTDVADPVRAGAVANYVIEVSNAGPSTATAIVVTDTLPAGMTFHAASSDASCSASGQTVTCTLSPSLPIAPGGSISLGIGATVDAAIDPGTVLTNEAAVDAAEADADTANNSTDETTTTYAQADLAISKTHDTGSIVAGTDTSWTIGLVNSGPSVARNVTITDVLPAGVTFIAHDASNASTTSDSRCTASGQTVTCSLGDVAVGQINVRIFGAVAATATEPIANTASVTTTTPGNCVTGSTDPACSVTSPAITPSTSAAVTVAKSLDNAPIVPGTPARFRIVVANAGPSAAANVVATDVLPTGLTFVANDAAAPTTTSSEQCTASGQTVTCSLGTMGVGSVTLFVVANVDPALTADVTNSVSVVTTTGPGCSSADPCVATSGPHTPEPAADLNAVKTLENAPLVAGRTAHWKVVVTNNGPSVATGVTVDDELDAHLIYNGGLSDSRCGATGQTVSCEIGTLGVSASTTIDLYTDVASDTPDGTTISNTATTGSETPDPITNCATCTAGPFTVDATADLVLAKTGSSSLIAGEDTTYAISVTNNGPSVATDVVVTDPLVAGLTFVSGTADQGTCSVASNGALGCDLGSIAPGAIVTIEVNAHVASTVAGGASLANNASVTSPTEDPDSTNNGDSVTSTVARTPGVTATKTASAATVEAGKPISYTITVKNDGPSEATLVTVADEVPAAITGVTVDPSDDCSVTANLVSCEFANVAAKDTRIITITGTVAADAGDGSTLTNTAQVSCANDECTPSEPSVEVGVIRRADLVTTKELVTDPVVAGEAATWKVTVRNDGPSVATAVQVADTLDARLSYVDADSDNRCDAAGQDVTCVIGTLNPGSSTVLTIVAKVSADAPEGERIANSVTTTSETVDPDPSCAGCVDPGTPTVTTADLVLTKSAAAANVVAGTNATWTLTLKNNGPSVARDVVVSDPLPAGLSFVVAGSDARCAATGVTVSCDLGDVAPASTITLTIVTAVDQAIAGGSSITNTATVTSPTTDPDPSCDGCDATIGIDASADLVMAKKLLTDPLVAGQTAEWELSVRNDGPSAATGVALSDALDDALSFVSGSSDPRCSAVGQTVTCVAGSLDSGASTSFRVITTVDPSTPDGTELSNTVTGGGEQPDPNPACEDCTVGPVPVEAIADLSIEKSGSSLVTAGTSTSYTMTVTNAGPSDAQDVVVADPMTSGLTATAAQSDLGPCDVTGGAVSCALGTLAAGQSVDITVEAAIAANVAPNAELTNTATVSTSTTDSNTENNIDSVTASVQRKAGVTATKTANTATATAGGSMVYTIEVSNFGPSVASAVTVTDDIPAEMTIDSVSPAGDCNVSGNTVTCELAELAVGSVTPIDIAVTLDADLVNGSSVTNTASVTCAGGECDPIEPEVATNVATSADLVTVKRQLTTPLVAGETGTWEITITNNGPSVARSVVATDTLVAPLTFRSADSDTRCTADGQVVTCTVGDMAPGAVEVMKIVADIDADTAEGTVIPNAVSVTTPTVDPNPSCASCTNPGTPVTTKADLETTKTALSSVVVAGEVATFKIRVENHGPSTARSVTAIDVLDSALTFVAADSDSRCGAIGQTVTCQVGDLASGAVTELLISATLDSDAADGVTVTNQVSVTSETTDPAPGCDSCTATIEVDTKADLVTSKTLVTDPIVAGAPVRWKVTVRNDGPSTARDVVVTDALATGLTFLAGPSTPGCYASGADVACPVGDVLAGATATVYIEAMLASSVADGATLSNTVEVVTPTVDPDPSCPDCTSTGTVTRQSNTWIEKSGSSLLTAGVATQWAVTFGNDGPSDAADVTVSDELPANFGAISVDAPAGVNCDVSGQTVTCDVADLPSGSTRTVTVHATPATSMPAGSTATNTATIDAPTDPAGPHTATASGKVARYAQVSLQKVAEAAAAVPGQPFTWTLIARNDGPSDATGVHVVDTIPAGLTVDSVSNPDCTIDGQTVDCVIDLAADQTLSIDVVTNVSPSYAASNITNVANLSCPGGECVDVEVTTTVASTPKADVVYAKTFDSAELVAGLDAKFTLSAHNNGPSDAQMVTITDELMVGLSFVAAESDSRCSAAGQLVTCSVSTLAADADVSFAITVAVAADFAADSVTNAITGTTSTPDPEPACESCSVGPIPVVRRADLDAVKSLIGDSLVAGAGAAYQIVVTNHGPSTATGNTITDALPTGLSFDAARSPGCSADGQTITCQVPDLAPDATYRQVIGVLVDSTLTAGTELTNTVVVEGEIPDPVTECAGCSTTDPVTTAADLVTVKRFVDSDLIPGTVAHWQITVTNNGPSTATEVTVSDSLHAALSFDATQSSPECSADAQDVTCALGTIAPHDSTTVLVAALVDAALPAGTKITNTVVTDGGEPDPETECAECTAVTPPANPTADLQLVMAASSTVVAGQPGSVVVSLANRGPSTTVGTEIRIQLPAALFGADGALLAPVTGSTPAGACSVEGTELVCPVGTFATGASFDMTIDFTAPAKLAHGSALGFSGQIRSAATEIDLDNNDDNAVMTVQRSSAVTITKTISTAAPVAGERLSWTITARNGGSSDQDTVTVVDTLPSSVTDAETTDDRCTIDGLVVTCVIPTLAAGADTTIELSALLKADTPEDTDVTNSATLRCVDNLCPETETSVTGTSKASADVSAVKSGDAALIPGTDATWSIVVTNNGPSVARAVTVTDLLHEALTVDADSLPEGCSAAGQEITCMVGDLAPDASVTLSFTTHVAEDAAVETISNSVHTETETPDPNTECPTCTVVIPVRPAADLEIEKTPVEGIVVPGGEVSWKIVVTNAGPSVARSVEVTDVLAEGITFASDDQNRCTAAGQTVTCAVGDLGVDESVTILLTATNDLPAGSDIGNTASVTSPTPEPEGGTRKPSTSEKQTVRKAAAISVRKDAVAAGTFVLVGDEVRYEIAVTNSGDVAATDVVLTDAYPAGLRFVRSDQDCTALPGTIRCEVPTLEAGATKSVTLTFSVLATDGALKNAATATGPGVEPAEAEATVEVKAAVAVTVPERLADTVAEAVSTLAHTGASIRLALFAGTLLVGAGCVALMGRRRRAAGPLCLDDER